LCGNLGTPQTFAIVLESGRVEKERKGEKRKLEKGDTSGLMHFFNQDECSATLTVLEDCEYLKFDSLKFKAKCESDASFNEAFVKFLTKEVRKRSNVLSALELLHGASDKVKVAFFDAKSYMQDAFDAQNATDIEFVYIHDYLTEKTSYMAGGCPIVSVFVNDVVNGAVVRDLAKLGVKMIALRCAGYDNVDLVECERLGISVTRVPAYSPYAVAEFAIALMMECNRKLHKSWSRVSQFNFSLSGLVGFDFHGKTVGVFGTGKIGICTINILRGFGCQVLCFDVFRNPEVAAMSGVKYVDTLEELWPQCDIITLHAPLLPSTKHCINADSISKMKKGVMIINTSRGALVDTPALLDGLVSGHIGSAGLDVYEGEKGIFYEDKSAQVMPDSILSRLISAHNVVLSSHQAFLTNEALAGISSSVIASVREFQSGKVGSQLTNFQGAPKTQ
jgi:D-lactate dehydrogenase